MSEVHKQAPNHEKLPSQEGNGEAAKQHLEALKLKAEGEGEKHGDQEQMASIKKNVEQSAVSKEDYQSTESGSGSENSPSQTFVSRELKQMGFRRTLTNARMHMKAPSRAFSKTIHQPVVEKISEIAAPTVARPSGILGGGIAALIGSSILLYVSKHYGYSYNFLIFFMLFIGGFAIGMIVELFVRALMRRRA